MALLPRCLKQIHSKLVSVLLAPSHSPSCLQACRYFHRHGVSRLCEKPPDGVSGPPWRVLFLGTDNFALHHLQALNENRMKGNHSIIKSLDVVVASGKSPVLRYAKQEKLHLYKWPLPDLRGHYDVGVIVSFGHLIPDDVINMFPRGMLNVHPSLLPRWRGAAPIQHTVLSGDRVTGVCIISIRPYKFDVGPILNKRTLPVPAESTTTSLQSTLAEQGAEMLLECLSDMDGLVPKEQETSKDKLTYARKLQQKHTYINWDCTMDDIDRQFRALGDSLNLRSMWRGVQVRLLDMVPLKDMADHEISQYLPPRDSGSIPEGAPLFMRDKGLLAIKCRDGWIGFRRIMIRKSMSAKEFYNGYLSKKENVGQLFVSQHNGLDKYFRR